MQVFRAAVKGMQSQVAVKLISYDGSSDMRRRALRELSHLRDCRHAHIVRCYGAALWDSDIAIVTEFLPRGTLYTALASRRLKWGPRWVTAAVVCIGSRLARTSHVAGAWQSAGHCTDRVLAVRFGRSLHVGQACQV